MRVIFMGSPDFAVPALHALVGAGHQVAAVYTQPPRPGGRRGKELTLTPVHQAAATLGLDVRHPARLRSAEDQADFAALNADIAVVAAYGLILPQAVLDAPRLGCVNIHASLLPRWRGAAPIHRAILAGDNQTGITIMQMDAGLDTGPMLARAATPVGGKTTGALTAELAAIGANLMIDVLADLPGHAPEAQPEVGVSYAHKVDKAEAQIDWNQPAALIERQVRAFTPAAWFAQAGERYRVLACAVIDAHGEAGLTLDDRLTIACGSGAIQPTVIQRAGRPAMTVADFLRGQPVAAGTVLG